MTTVKTGQGTDKLFSLSDEELEYIDYLYNAGAPDVADIYTEMLSAYDRYWYSPVDTLFLGDSITQGLPTQDMFSMRTVNRGIGGDTIEGLTARLNRIVELRPKRIFLMIGVNNFYYMEERFRGKYDELLSKAKKLMPDTKFYLQSILPVDMNVRPDISNLHLSLLNGIIKDLAETYEMTYIDLFSEMLDETGNMFADYVKDGLHLTDKGIYRWFEVIRLYVENNKAY